MRPKRPPRRSRGNRPARIRRRSSGDPETGRRRWHVRRGRGALEQAPGSPPTSPRSTEGASVPGGLMPGKGRHEPGHSPGKVRDECRATAQRFVTAGRVARFLRLHPETLRRWVARGLIEARWRHGRWRFRLAQVRLVARAGPVLQRVGRAAKTAGVHPRTIARWEARGMLRSIRTPGGHRWFRRADLLRLRRR